MLADVLVRGRGMRMRGGQDVLWSTKNVAVAGFCLHDGPEEWDHI